MLSESLHQILLAGGIYFFYVFFKAAQQRNVAFLHYKWILPISYAMAATEVFVISLVTLNVVQRGGITLDMAWFALSIGTGGGLGALLAMRLHEMYLGAGINKRHAPGATKDKIGGKGG